MSINRYAVVVHRGSEVRKLGGTRGKFHRLLTEKFPLITEIYSIENMPAGILNKPDMINTDTCGQCETGFIGEEKAVGCEGTRKMWFHVKCAVNSKFSPGKCAMWYGCAKSARCHSWKLK
jgi:hypothetical protein